MSEPRKRGEWQTPVAFMKNREEMYKKLESLGNKITDPIDTENEISYFNNPRATGHTAAFDLFFAYTKTFPLFDERKGRDDRKYLPDIWDNIHEQESRKNVPALTSMNYGKRPNYDPPPGIHNRRSHIANFYRRKQVFNGVEKQPFSEDYTYETLT